MTLPRKSGILLHPTSLPGAGGIGSLGSVALRFVDFLHASGQSLWQILPLGPPGCGNSPYSCFSAFAGNPLLIDLQLIEDEGDLENDQAPPLLPDDRVDFCAAHEYKVARLRIAAESFFRDGAPERKQDFWNFCDATFWLHDYALFMALKTHFKGKPWNRWPEKIRRRSPSDLEDLSRMLGSEIGVQKYMQWQFSRQWHGIKKYANDRAIAIIGDAPIFVAMDSVDVWCNQQLFKLDDQGNPVVVAGVPPDYFSRTGQRWGNPLYNWENLAADGYGWWLARIRNDLSLYDIVRIDHFRGFEACWEIPASEKTAVRGSWVKGPGAPFFQTLRNHLGSLPIIAEDLGVITPEVESLRDNFGLPGMRILQFAFDGGPVNSFLPHNHISGCVVYTGTHDNDTTRGWFDALDGDRQNRVCEYLRTTSENVVEEFIRSALASVAGYSIIPLQDLLGLDGSARMNLPGVSQGNWGWRFRAGCLTAELSSRLRLLTEMYNRIGQQ